MPDQTAALRDVIPPTPYPNVAAEPTFTPLGWFADHPILEQLIRERHPTILLDVGSFWGASAALMARYAGPDATVIAIDTWLGSLEYYTNMRMSPTQLNGMFDTFCANIARAGVASRVIALRQTSITAAKILTHYGIKPQFIYLDASHEYDDVLRDLRAYWELLAPDGVLVGDDYENPWPDVIKAATQFADENRLALETAVGNASYPKYIDTSAPTIIKHNQVKFVLRK